MLNNCLTLQTKLVISKKLAEENLSPLTPFCENRSEGASFIFYHHSNIVLNTFKTPLNPRLELFYAFECRSKPVNKKI